MKSVIWGDPTLGRFLLVACLDILFAVRVMRFDAHDESMSAPRFLGDAHRQFGALGRGRQRECLGPSTPIGPNSPSNSSWSVEP